MPNAGFQVNPDTMIDCGDQISGLSDKADQLRRTASNAHVPNNAWGAVGLLTFDEYRDMLGRLQTHLDEVSAGLTSAGDKIAECGRHYQDSDRLVAEKLRKILRELGQVRS